MSVDPRGFPRDFSTFVIQGLITSPQSREKILVKNAVSKTGRVTVTCQGVQEPDYGHSLITNVYPRLTERPIADRWGGGIGTYIWQPNLRRWEIFGAEPCASWIGEWML